MAIKKDNNIYIELQNSIAKLEYELRISNERVAYLQGELDQVSSLKAHIKKYIKKQARRVDYKIEISLKGGLSFNPVVPNNKIKDLIGRANNADDLNFKKINSNHQANRKLRVYQKSKKTIIGFMKKVNK